MDYFTKWSEACSISEDPDCCRGSSSTLDLAIRILLQLHSDQGTNFDSAVCKRLCEILGIDKTQTTVLHPQSDGMVERFNRAILNSLSLLVSSNQQDWDKKLPFFLLAYRTVVNDTTGYCPSQMLF
ncbi:retrovirus-related Pol polyprotein from transposon 412 [Trichonephila clavipes]|nr:retrovirus-related Pol polyprotein from transposon 412 [Trichonephila clavipes]